MNSSILVCDDIQYNKQEDFFTLGKIINSIEVPTLPYVHIFKVFIKLNYMHEFEDIDVKLVLTDNENQLISISNPIVAHNSRPEGYVPGISMFLTMTGIVCKKGNIHLHLVVNNEKINSYPIKLNIKE
ncbi:hypothetical protein C8Z91_34260 [Paenibacillus elgii]|uniref:Uncharacterized protein n=1 Tax=Paenibacillus elgii TaxID=189691 RepID=A0A2T6FSP0_9BACL|nr:hypothetical protein [Paenibacillus elgii]PUA34933.1 hypothetical protein C8Z91_34260 [Paenibacillus elgii]